MRYVKYAILALLALVLLTLALANRAPVTLRLLPTDMAGFLGLEYAIELPLFLVILGGVLLGLTIGFVWEWLREYRHRAEARRARREAEALEARLGKAGRGRKSEGDDVLAILEEDDARRLEGPPATR
ncbi:LapA family protein [Alkalilacustris brevis]|uniref:LapA family protein n=1 Tax=Alkalilacustris brevis TaxID=2026338 RepID=UPI000E0D58CF|nr:LapA family protein [Alkalilacustris brevis]